MRINKVEDKHVEVSLDADELVSLSNFIYEVQKQNGDDLRPKDRELYAQIMTARDLCQYGHVDGFTLRHIVMEKYKAGNQSPNTEIGRMFAKMIDEAKAKERLNE